MTTNKENKNNIKDKINYINSYGFNYFDKIYNKKNVEALAPNLNALKGKNNKFYYPLSINTWDNKKQYIEKAKMLARLFQDNFKKISESKINHTNINQQQLEMILKGGPNQF